MSHRGHHFIIGSKEALNLGTLGRAFYDDEFHSGVFGCYIGDLELSNLMVWESK
jgi:hypothetical protein